MRVQVSLILLPTILVWLHTAQSSTTRLSAQEPVDFQAQVRPILKERCFACHGALKQEADLRVDSAKLLREGGDSGSAIDLGQPAESELLIRVTDPDESTRMPPEGKPLTPEEIQLIKDWIRQGAKIPDNDHAETSPAEHWAFQKPEKIELNVEDGQNPVDVLLQKARNEKGIKASSSTASKSLLLRRVYLDLIGIPPSREQMASFLADSRKDAYERVVDELLARPQFGERWGRHWMDVWRYTDWYGLGAQLRNSQKHIWRWRDWIIESLNDDKGFDEMVLEMLAADELYPTDPKRLRATGFLARNYYLFNRTTWLDSTIEHTGKAFLGLTLNCAKCHDHKYDPITQEDYYRVRAVFEPHQVRMDPVPGSTNLDKDGLPRVFDAHPKAPTYVHVRGNEKDPDKSKIIAPNVPGFFGFDYDPQAVALPPEAARPSVQSFVLRDHLKELDQSIEASRKKVISAKSQLAKVQSGPSETERVRYHQFKLKDLPKESIFLKDSFDHLDQSVWKIVNGDWKIEGGKLVQSQVGADARVVESVKRHPEDFLAVVKLSVSGGQTWKSFGLRFDVGNQHEKTVYLSAFQDSKVQVSFSNKGNTTYPTTGLAKIPVKLDQSYLLTVAVRGTLINVSVDGQHLVTFEFPVKRQAGKIQLMSFDSIAAFDSIDVLGLPKDLELYPANGESVVTVEEASLAVRLAELDWKQLVAKRAAVESGHRADRAKIFGPADGVSAFVIKAVADQLEYDRIRKQFELANTRKQLAATLGEKRAPLEKKIADLEFELKKLNERKPDKGSKYHTIQASQKALEGPDEKPASRNLPYPKTSTGRRTAFARWIVDSENPMTARVAVNQIWMRHFGRPLVESVEDFGRRAKKPIQSDLLDWLAVDLMENDWKMKRIHRLIVTSKAYRMASRDEKLEDEGWVIEHGNPYYQVRSSLRMESQVVRDSLLSLAGNLEEKLNGPPIDPNQPSNRRSLYFRQSRDHHHKFVNMFDDADILRCYRRQESIIPQQALTLFNSKLAYESARQIAANLTELDLSDQAFVEEAFLLILCRQASSEEVRSCLDALNELAGLSLNKADQKIRARTGVVLGIINSNDFVTIR